MWLSIQGIYEFDPTVFDGFEAPTYTDPDNNIHVLNRDDVINNILLQCAELEVVYPSPQMMKFAIGVWSASNHDAWNRLYATQLMTYNPLWNVDATETETETNERDISRQHTGANNKTLNITNAETRNLSDAETRNLSDAETINITDTESVQGFNSDQWSEAKKNAKNGTDTVLHTGTNTVLHTGTNTVLHTGTDNITESGTDNTSITNNETVNDDNERVLSKRRTGNIGITSSQSLVLSEREVAKFSIVEYITQSFKERFCLLIY